MAQKLDYCSPKWEKEQKRDLQCIRQLKGSDIAMNDLQRILRMGEKISALQGYGKLYTDLHLNYRIVAGKTYLRDTMNEQSIQYTYLAGMSAVLAYLFYVSDLPQEQSNTDRQNVVLDFTFGVLQLYAVDQPLPPCIRHINNPYLQLLLENMDTTAALLSTIGSQFDPINPYTLWLDEMQKATIQSIIEKDAQSLQNLLVKRIKQYRKLPLGCSTLIDVYSIAMIKLAQQYGMDCDLDIIEIPKMFFDPQICKRNTEEVELPFFDNALEQLKKLGVTWG